jgi:hypothetical protein
MPAIVSAIEIAQPAIFLETATELADELIDAMKAHDMRRDMLGQIAQGFRAVLDETEGEERNRVAEDFADKLRRDAAVAATWDGRTPLERTAPTVHDRPIDQRLLAARANYAKALEQLERVAAAFRAPASDEIKARNTAALSEFARDLEADAFCTLAA